MGFTLNQCRLDTAARERNRERRSGDSTADNDDPFFQANPQSAREHRYAPQLKNESAQTPDEPISALFAERACLGMFYILNTSLWINTTQMIWSRRPDIRCPATKRETSAISCLP